MTERKCSQGFAAVAVLTISLMSFPTIRPVDAALSGSLPADSVYNLAVNLEDQFGKVHGLDQHKGQATLITMLYASCPHVCPMIISTIKLTESKLSAEEQAGLRVMTISIDPERDTPEALRELMERHAVDESRWSLVRPDPGDLRAIAGVFGFKYKQLPDGEFNHSTKIILLDSDGRQIASTGQLGRHDPAFLEAIKANLRR
jgi:protein SCO1/2